MRYPITCQLCGGTAEARDSWEQKRKKYCSPECHSRALQNGKSVKCDHCGNEFYKPKGQLKWDRNFCSKECRVAAGWREGEPSKKAEFVCKVCNKAFVGWVYRQPTTCSKKCASTLSRGVPKPTMQRPENFITKKCKTCGTEYTRHKIFFEKRNSNFCSMSCRAEWKSKNFTGANNINWVGGVKAGVSSYRGENWDSQKRKAEKRDKYTCRGCGKKKVNHPKTRFGVHHKIPYRMFNGDYKKANHLTNLVYLCSRCHAKAEKKIREEEKRGGIQLPLV